MPMCLFDGRIYKTASNMGASWRAIDWTTALLIAADWMTASEMTTDRMVCDCMAAVALSN